VFNKSDLRQPDPALVDRLAAAGVRAIAASALSGEGLAAVRAALLEAAPADYFDSRRIIADLVQPGELVVLVVPIDKEAPKGRLILPQVQTIRDLLDADALCMVTKERELRAALDRLRQPPALVVTDSQAFLKVAADTPRNVPMTSFSILFARFQGDLPEQVRGTLGIDRLRTGDRVLIAESCTHHPIGEDIGRVKIPRWLREYSGARLEFDTVQGRDFPDDLSPWALVVHCGNCMGNRREMLSRILRCRQQNVPITNYGLTIAYSLGILERALEPFPAALDAFRSAPSPPPAQGLGVGG
jgi:[FeFe] hydrogenase H-cluster maturation GTPase HydF